MERSGEEQPRPGEQGRAGPLRGLSEEEQQEDQADDGTSNQYPDHPPQTTTLLLNGLNNHLRLHVLTATDADVADVEGAVATVTDKQVQVKLGAATITFGMDKVGGTIGLAGRRTNLTETVVLPYAQWLTQLCG